MDRKARDGMKKRMGAAQERALHASISRRRSLRINTTPPLRVEIGA